MYNDFPILRNEEFAVIAKEYNRLSKIFTLSSNNNVMQNGNDGSDKLNKETDNINGKSDILNNKDYNANNNFDFNNANCLKQNNKQLNQQIYNSLLNVKNVSSSKYNIMQINNILTSFENLCKNQELTKVAKANNVVDYSYCYYVKQTAKLLARKLEIEQDPNLKHELYNLCEKTINLLGECKFRR